VAACGDAGRVRIQKNLTVPAHPEIFVVGDTAAFEQDGKPLPGVARVAMLRLCENRRVWVVRDGLWKEDLC